MTMTQSGLWWLSTSPETRIPGELNLRAGRRFLSTIGRLDPLDDNGGEPGYRLESRTIMGYTTDGPVSLWGCRWIQERRGQLIPQDESRQYAQVWEAGTLIVGRTIGPTFLFASASIAIEGLTWWWEDGMHRARRAHSSDALLNEKSRREPITIPLPGDWEIDLGSDGQETLGIHDSRYERRTLLRVSRTDGFTRAQLYAEVIYPLRAMLAMAFKFNVGIQQERLFPPDPQNEWEHLTVDPEKYQEVADPGEWVGRRDQALFTAKNVDAARFIRSWMELAPELIMTFAVILNDEPGRALQLSVVDTVSAAETLHRALERRLHDRERQYGPKQDKRLRELANGLETAVQQYVLGDATDYWASVAAEVRNVLTHGIKVSHGVHEDVPALIAILEITAVVTELRLAIACGLRPSERLVRHLERIRRYEGVAHQKLVAWPELHSRILAERSRRGSSGVPVPGEGGL